MKKLVLLIVFHTSAWGMESERKEVKEVPSLAHLCINAIASIPYCDEQSIRNISHLIFTKSFTPAQNSQLITHCLHLLKTARAGLYYNSAETSITTEQVKPLSWTDVYKLIKQQNSPLQVIDIRGKEEGEKVLHRLFLEFLYGQNARSRNIIITLTRRDAVSSYLLVEGNKHTIITHTNPDDIRYYHSQTGLIAATCLDWRALAIKHLKLINSTVDSTFTVPRILTTTPLCMAASRTTSHLHVAEESKDGICSIVVIPTERPLIKSYRHTGSKHVDCLLPSLRNPSRSQRVFHSNPNVDVPYVCCTHNHAGCLYAYALRDGSIGVRTYPKGDKILFTATPQHTGTPEAIFFDETDRYLRCLTRNDSQVYIHQFDLARLNTETSQQLFAPFLIPQTNITQTNAEEKHSALNKLSQLTNYIKHTGKKLLD